MKRIFFGLQHVPSGQLLRLERNYHDDECQLTLDPAAPVFEAESMEALAKVLFDNVPGYNSSPDLPSWGPFSEDELQPVSVEVTTSVTALPKPAPLKLSILSTRDAHLKVASNYAGRPLVSSTPEKRFALWLVALKPGQSLEALQAHVGQVVYSNDRWNRRLLYAAVPVPEENRIELKGKPGALLVVSEPLHGALLPAK